VVAGIVHAGLAPVIVVADVKPNLVLVAVVLVAAQFGFLPGVIWAFVAGLTANLLVPAPLGSIPLALLLVAALVAGGEGLFGRIGLVYPVVAALLGSVLADAVALLVFRLVADPVQVGVPMDLILPAAFLNAAIAALLAVPLRLVARRYASEERPAW
jgi:cell shape-determining protein MreD